MQEDFREYYLLSTYVYPIGKNVVLSLFLSRDEDMKFDKIAAEKMDGRELRHPELHREVDLLLQPPKKKIFLPARDLSEK